MHQGGILWPVLLLAGWLVLYVVAQFQTLQFRSASWYALPMVCEAAIGRLGGVDNGAVGHRRPGKRIGPSGLDDCAWSDNCARSARLHVCHR